MCGGVEVVDDSGNGFEPDTIGAVAYDQLSGSPDQVLTDKKRTSYGDERLLLFQLTTPQYIQLLLLFMLEFLLPEIRLLCRLQPLQRLGEPSRWAPLALK